MSVIVTLKEGTKTRRYVVAAEDEHLFDGVKIEKGGYADFYAHPLDRVWFGGQWLRGPNKVDECYRSLCGNEVIAITRKHITSHCSCGCGAGINR